MEVAEIVSAIDKRFMSLFPQATISQDNLIWLRGELNKLAADCGFLNLYTTHNLIQAFSAKYRDVTPSGPETREGLMTILNGFKAELGTQLFMYVLPARVNDFEILRNRD